MKGRIAVAALGLVLAGAHAPAEGADEIVGIKKNVAGGEILLTNAKCGTRDSKGKNGWVIISSRVGGTDSVLGCVTKLHPDRFIVSWSDGSISILSQAGWSPTPTAPRGRSMWSDR